MDGCSLVARWRSVWIRPCKSCFGGKMATVGLCFGSGARGWQWWCMRLVCCGSAGEEDDGITRCLVTDQQIDAPRFLCGDDSKSCYSLLSSFGCACERTNCISCHSDCVLEGRNRSRVDCRGREVNFFVRSRWSQTELKIQQKVQYKNGEKECGAGPIQIAQIQSTWPERDQKEK